MLLSSGNVDNQTSVRICTLPVDVAARFHHYCPHPVYVYIITVSIYLAVEMVSYCASIHVCAI